MRMLSLLRKLSFSLFAACSIWAQMSVACDVDGNGAVDRRDLTLISAAIAGRESVTGPNDLRDGNHDGKITILDTVACKKICTLPNCNSRPDADAGLNQLGMPGQTVTLDGSGSSDADGQALTYLWTLYAPNGSSATLPDYTAIRPQFVPDIAGDYEIQLVVNDGSVDSEIDTIFVTTSGSNLAPTANAGQDQSVPLGGTVQLDGSRSYDANQDILGYTWQLTSVPAGSAATLSDPYVFNPSFVADVAGLYTLSLTVNDGYVHSIPVTVSVTTTAKNAAPIANAGLDSAVAPGTTFQLNGAASYDPDGGTLRYRWTLVSRPAGSAATLNGATTIQPSFVADIDAGQYVVQLIVNDGKLDSQPDNVVIVTTPGNSRPIADAGPDHVTYGGPPPQGAAAPLDGKASHDPDNDPLTYLWSIKGRPFGSDPAIAKLDAPTSDTPNLTTDRAGDYIVQLVVTDDKLLSSDPTQDPNPVSIVRATNKQAPVAIADAPIDTIYVTETIQLVGSGSYDPDGCPLTYRWNLEFSPLFHVAEENYYIGAEISDMSAPNPTAYISGEGTNDRTAGEYRFGLYVKEAPVPGDTRGCGEATVSVFADKTIHVIDAPNVSLSNATIVEGNSGEKQVVLTLTTTGRVLRSESVSYSTVNGSATAGEDYTAISGDIPLIDEPNGASRTISLPPITIFGDTKYEQDETFSAHLSGPSTVQTHDSTVTIQNDDPQGSPATTLVVTPAQLQLLSYATGSLTITTGSPAPAGGMDISLESNTPDSVSIPASVHLNQGETSKTVNVLAGSVTGVATITASFPSWTSGHAAVEVKNRTATLSLQSPIIAPNRQTTATLYTPNPLPATPYPADFSVSVALNSASPNVATVPASVFIAPNQTTQTFQVSGIGDGTSFISATAPGFTIAGINVDVTSTKTISLGNTLPEIGPGSSVSLPISLVAPAVGNVTVSLASLDPTIASVSPAQVTILSGQTTPAANPQITGVSTGSGTAKATTSISASATGYAPDARDITVSLGMSLAPTTATLSATRTQLLTLYLSHPAPAGGLAITLSSDAAAVATLTADIVAPCAVNTCVVIPQGQLSAVLTLTGVSAGSTLVRASTPGLASVSAAVTISPAPRISVWGSYTPPTYRVGEDLQIPIRVNLEQTPTSPVTLTATSSNGSVVQVVADEASVGKTTDSIANVSNGYQYFRVHGLQQGGSAQITFSAPGYADTTMTVEVDPSGFVWASKQQSGNYTGFTTNTLAANTTLMVFASRLERGTLRPVEGQEVRGGLAPVSIPITQSVPGIGTLTPNPVMAAAVANGTLGPYYESTYTTAFDPVAGGVTTLTLGVPAGWDTPANSATNGSPLEQVATVTLPHIYVNSNYQTPQTYRVGEDLQIALDARLENTPVGPAGTTVTMTAASADSSIAIVSPQETGIGSASATRIYSTANYNTNQRYWIQGLKQGSTVTLTFSAPGYVDNVVTIAVDPSGFVTTTQNFTSTTAAADTTIVIYAARLNPTSGTLGAVELQELRGGVTASVPVTSSDTAVGVITTSPVVVQAVADNTTSEAARTRFDPVGGPGSAIVTIETALDFDTPGTGGSYSRFTVGTVNP